MAEYYHCITCGKECHIGNSRVCNVCGEHYCFNGDCGSQEPINYQGHKQYRCKDCEKTFCEATCSYDFGDKCNNPAFHKCHSCRKWFCVDHLKKCGVQTPVVKYGCGENFCEDCLATPELCEKCAAKK